MDASTATAATAERPSRLFGLARTLIVPSLTNPRSQFDEAYLNELATSMREHGILQPVLVRPLPGHRLQDTAHLTPRPTHEIVCGECRYRAAGLAGIDELPVLERDLDDLQVLQVQLVENLKRRDLHPLEEAEGFERLVKDHGLTVDDVAARIDKSASYIYKLMKLLELTPECRVILYQGKLTQSTALLVARAPAYLQKEIAQDIVDGGAAGEPMSYRQALDHIHRRYMLRLADAVFDIKDASLVAKAGSCITCAKNTGCNKDLFGDVSGGDTCTDPKCFDAKKVAHFAQLAAKAQAEGKTVIAGKEAKELYRDAHDAPKGYTRLDDGGQYVNGKYTTLRKALGKELPATTLIVNPFTNDLEEVLPTPVATRLLNAAKRTAKATEAVKAKDKAPSKEDLENTLRERFEDRAITRVHAAIMEGRSPGITVPLARLMAMRLEDNMYGEAADRFARLFDVPAAKVATSAGLQQFLRECPDATVGPALLVLLTEDDLGYQCGIDPWDSEILKLIAADAGVDLQAVKAEIQAEMKAEAAERKKAAEDKATPAAKKPAGKKKTTAAEAKAGISTELRKIDDAAFAIGDLVRFKEGLRGPNGHIRKVCGREGYIDRIQPEGDRPTYGVRYGDKGSDYASGTADELELVKKGPPTGRPASWPKKTGAPAKMKTAAPAKMKTAAPGDDAALPLKNGGAVDPAAAWPFPTVSKAAKSKAAAA